MNEHILIMEHTIRINFRWDVLRKVMKYATVGTPTQQYMKLNITRTVENIHLRLRK